MSTSTSAVNADRASVLALDTGDTDPLAYGDESDCPGVWLSDGDDAVFLAAADPADVLAALDRARDALVARFPDLATPGTDDAPTPRRVAPYATDDGIVLPTYTLASWAGRPLDAEDVARVAAALPFGSVPEAVGTTVAAWDADDDAADEPDRCGQCNRVLDHAGCPDLRCAWWTADAEEGDDETAPARTCRDCGAPLDSNGTAWVDARSGDDGGTYDLCPERWDEATDTDHGHRPA